jgi:hypothetical protein
MSKYLCALKSEKKIYQDHIVILYRYTAILLLTLTYTPSVPSYLAQVKMTGSHKLNFDHSFTLYYIIYAY